MSTWPPRPWPKQSSAATRRAPTSPPDQLSTSAVLLYAASLRDVHVVWAWVTIVSNGLVGLWALGAHRLPALRTRALWWTTAGAQLAMFIQVAIGVGLVSGQGIDPPQFHMFYGFVAIIAIAILYSYRQQLRHRLYLLYGLGSLFVMGLGIRAVLVGTAG